MPIGSIGGYTKNWSSQEINDARQAGQFFQASPQPQVQTPAPTTSFYNPVKTTTPTTAPTSQSFFNSTPSSGSSGFYNPSNVTYPTTAPSAQSFFGNTSGGGGNSGGYVFNPPYSGGGGGGGSSSPSIPTGPSASELEAQRKAQEAQTNYDKLLKLVETFKSKAPVEITPPTYNPFISNSEMAGKLGVLQSAMDSFNSPYNLDNDQQYQTAVAAMEKNLTKQFAKRGMAYSNSAKAAIAQKAAELGGQFQQQEMVRRQQNINNLAQQLGVMANFEKNNYNQYRDTVADVNSKNTLNFNNWNDLLGKAFEVQKQGFSDNVTKSGITGEFEGNKTEEQKRYDRNLEIATYGTELNPQVRTQLDMLKNLPSGIKMGDLTKYSQDYALEINRRAKEFPNDPLIPYLLAARTQKILSTPALLQQYGQDIGLSNPLIATNAQAFSSNALKANTEMFKAYAEQIKAQYLAATEKVKLDEAIANAEKGKWDAAKAKIEAINAPEQVKADLMYKLEQIESQKANQVQSYASAGASGSTAALNEQRRQTEMYNTDIYKNKADASNQELNADTPVVLQNMIESGKPFDQWYTSPMQTGGQIQPGQGAYSGIVPVQNNTKPGETMGQKQLELLLDALQKIGKFKKSPSTDDPLNPNSNY